MADRALPDSSFLLAADLAARPLTFRPSDRRRHRSSHGQGRVKEVDCTSTCATLPTWHSSPRTLSTPTPSVRLAPQITACKRRFARAPAAASIPGSGRPDRDLPFPLTYLIDRADLPEMRG